MPEQAPAPAPSGGQQQPPFGSSPATGPTPNKGYEAAGMQRLGLVVKTLEELVPMFGAASEPGKAVLEALNKLVKLVPSGSVSPAAEKNQLQQMQMRNTQQNAQMQALKQQPQGGAPQQAAAA